MSAYSNDSRRGYHNSRRDTESCYQSSRSRETKFAYEKHHNKKASSRRTKALSESEGSAGGHWKSKSKRQKSSIEEDDLSQPWVYKETDPFTPRIRYFDFQELECIVTSRHTTEIRGVKGSVSSYTYGWDRSSSSILDFCLLDFDFQCPPALPSLSDSAFVLREDAFSASGRAMDTSGSEPFQGSILLLNVIDSEYFNGSSCRSTLVGLHRKQACPSPARFALFLAYSVRQMQVD
nr:reverse transcriptase domain-containing protein [Tanacetum cinerariifolium]